MEGWSGLPIHIIDLFVERLGLKEFCIVSCVCKSWRQAAVQKWNRAPRFGPWLIFAHEDQGGRCCYSVSNKEMLSLPSPLLQGRRGWGTPYGWIITLGLDLRIHLLNPLTHHQISLPPLPTFKIIRDTDLGFVRVGAKHVCRVFIKKLALSADPSDSLPSLVVLAIHGGCGDLSFASPGDKAWTPVRNRSPLSPKVDIIFYNHHFYSICDNGMLILCNINATTNEPEEYPIASKPLTIPYLKTFYLIEILGGLHCICRSMKDYTQNHPLTNAFHVYKFDFNIMEWVGIDDLHGLALFVGNNTSFSLSASHYPQLNPNCIYFTDDYPNVFEYRLSRDMGVYDFARKTFLDPPFKSGNSFSTISGPFYFMPCTKRTHPIPIFPSPPTTQPTHSSYKSPLRL